jgi:hypothetical protein
MGDGYAQSKYLGYQKEPSTYSHVQRGGTGSTGECIFEDKKAAAASVFLKRGEMNFTASSRNDSSQFNNYTMGSTAPLGTLNVEGGASSSFMANASNVANQSSFIKRDW